jgi:4-nitrophenyl phosphatase
MISDIFPNLRGVILDMDGVLWKDTQPLGNLPDLFTRMKKSGLGITLATNNATKTTEEYLAKLHGFGVDLEPWQIINSSEAAGFLLRERFPRGGPVFVVGESSLKQVLSTYGFNASGNDGSDILAVVAGMDRTLTFDKLRTAALLIRRGVLFVGTNPDRTFPTPEGLIPGAGSILAAIETATDTRPIIAGKPAPSMFRLAIERLGAAPENVLCIGDRLETDIAGGQSIGCKTALVLSGVTTLVAAKEWKPAPDLIVPDLTALFE